MKVSYSHSIRYIELGWVTLQRRWWVKSRCRFTRGVVQLETKASWLDKNGIHPAILIELATEHWIWTAFTILATIIGVVAWFSS